MRKFAIPVVLVFALLMWSGPAATVPQAGAAPGDKLSYALSQLAIQPAGGQSAAAVVANGAAVGLSATGGGSLQTDPLGRVLVLIRVSDTSPATQNALTLAGATIRSVQVQYRTISAYVAVNQLTAVAALPQVENIRQALRPGTDREDLPQTMAPAAPAFACGTPSGNAISEGNAQLNANAARTTYVVNGSGVKVGVESDSYNGAFLPPTTPAQDILSDDLPGPGNPCGFVTPNQIIQDCPFGCIDEGRAMMQIIHDLAPGSPLAFGSPNDEADFATLLTAMQVGGARVFSDDLNFFEDPFYQEGPIGVAAGNAKAAGMLSFTSAGNMNSAIGGVNWNGYEAGAYRPMTCPVTVPPIAATHDCHNFGTGITPDATYRFDAGGDARPILQWAEPRFGVTTDMDFYLLDSAGNILRTSADNNTGGGGTQLPYEFWSYGSITPNVSLVVARRTGFVGTPRFKIVFFRTGTITNVEYVNAVNPADSVGHMIIGHHCSQNFMSIGATPGGGPGTALETYSGFGPCTFYFGPVVGAIAAAPIAPLVVPKPDVVASDCTTNTFFLPPGPPYQFCGTSASSPHAAAVAALLMSFKPLATVTDIQNAILNNATAMAGGPDRVGHGLVNALAAMNALNAAAALPPTATKAFSPASVPLNTPSTLTITITNPNATVLTGVGFTDTFPGGMVVAPTPALTNTCGGAPAAVAGGSSLALTGGTIAAAGSCTVTVAVVATSGVALPNSTGPIASSAGPGLAANATLTIVPAVGGAPTATKTFTPNTVAVGGTSILTITLTNPNLVPATGVAFSDIFPGGMLIAATPALTNTCGGSPSAVAGSFQLALTGGTIPASGSCTVTVTVIATGAGSLLNSTGPITSSAGTGTAASATLTVTGGGGGAPPTPVPSPTPTPTPIPGGGAGLLPIPQRQQNPFAIAAILGGGMGPNNPPPPPGPPPVVLGVSRDPANPASITLRPPNTGEAGLKAAELEDEAID